MGQQQRELRRAASRAFLQSLDQLQATLHSVDREPLHNESSVTERPYDLSVLEQAVTDIEEFMNGDRQAVRLVATNRTLAWLNRKG